MRKKKQATALQDPVDTDMKETSEAPLEPQIESKKEKVPSDSEGEEVGKEAIVETERQDDADQPVVDPVGMEK